MNNPSNDRDTPPQKGPSRLPPPGLGFLVSLTLGIVVLVPAYIFYFHDHPIHGNWWGAALGLGFGVTASIVTTLLLQYIRSVTRTEYRIAVTGLPAAGKTVFTILAFDALMNERMPGISFTAESRSIISVYQAIRNLPADIWPAPTVVGNALQYAGTVRSGRRLIDLDIVDSAGEYWLDFSNEETRDRGYLEYVLEADSQAHVMPLDILVKDGATSFIQKEISDLKTAARLRRSVREPVPLIVILSKADLVINDDQLLGRLGENLFVPFSWKYFEESPIFQDLLRSAWRSRLDLRAEFEKFINRLADDYREINFLVSTASVVTNPKFAARHGGELLDWISVQSRKRDDRRRRERLFKLNPQV